jgi:hypothetical protein
MKLKCGRIHIDAEIIMSKHLESSLRQNGGEGALFFFLAAPTRAAHCTTAPPLSTSPTALSLPRLHLWRA